MKHKPPIIVKNCRQARSIRMRPTRKSSSNSPTCLVKTKNKQTMQEARTSIHLYSQWTLWINGHHSLSPSPPVQIMQGRWPSPSNQIAQIGRTRWYSRTSRTKSRLRWQELWGSVLCSPVSWQATMCTTMPPLRAWWMVSSEIQCPSSTNTTWTG